MCETKDGLSTVLKLLVLQWSRGLELGGFSEEGTSLLFLMGAYFILVYQGSQMLFLLIIWLGEYSQIFMGDIFFQQLPSKCDYSR